MDNLVLQLSGESNPSSSPSPENLHPLIPLLSTPAMVAADCSDDSPRYTGCATADESSASSPVAPLSLVLVGVVVFVDVHTESDNRSRTIQSVLRQLGATVSSKLTRDVTHVVFKGGKQRTYTLAQKYGAMLVSVMWVIRCKETGTRISEQEFPVPLQHQVTPLPFGRLKRYRSMQPKSMDECEADSEKKLKRRKKANRWKVLHTPADPPLISKLFIEDSEKRLQYLDADGSDGDSSSSSLKVPDTPPSLRKRVLPKFRSTPVGTPVAREIAIESGSHLQQRQLFGINYVQYAVDTNSGTESLGVCAETATNCVNKSSALTSTSSLSPEIRVVPNTRIVGISLGSLTSLCNSNGILLEDSSKSNTKRRSSTSPDISERSNTKKQKTNYKEKFETLSSKQSECVTLIPISQLTASHQHETSAGKSAQNSKHVVTECVQSSACSGVENPSSVLSYEICKPDECISSMHVVPAKRQSIGRRSISKSSCPSVLFEPQNRQENIHSGDGSKKQQDRSPAAFKVIPIRQVNSPRTGIGINSSKKVFFSSPLLLRKSTEDESMLDKKDCVVQKCLDSLVLETRVVKKTLNLPSSVHHSPVPFCLSDDDCDTESSDHSSNVTSEPDLVRLTRLPSAWQNQADSQKTVSCKTIAKNVTSGNSKDKKKNSSKPNTVVSFQPQTRDSHKICSIVRELSQNAVQTLSMTSLHRNEQAIVHATVQKLEGRFTVVDKIEENTTHIVCGGNRRTIKLLLGIARGCWIVSLDWEFRIPETRGAAISVILKSSASGRWIDEEDYEQEQYFPAAAVSRKTRETTSNGLYQPSLFCNMCDIYIDQETTPPCHDLKKLVTLCGGQISTRPYKGCVFVGRFNKNAKASVSEQWILDSVTKFCALEFDDYLLTS